MSLTKDEKREYQREYMRQRRSNKTGLTNDGSNSEGLTEKTGLHLSPSWQGMEEEEMAAEGMAAFIDLITDRKQRTGLEKVVAAFKESHHPEYAADVYVGVYGPTVLEAGDFLECTQDIPLPA